MSSGAIGTPWFSEVLRGEQEYEAEDDAQRFPEVAVFVSRASLQRLYSDISEGQNTALTGAQEEASLVGCPLISQMELFLTAINVVVPSFLLNTYARPFGMCLSESG